MALLKLTDKYSAERLENACAKALTYTESPSYKSIKNILTTTTNSSVKENVQPEIQQNPHAITRGADYYRRQK